MQRRGAHEGRSPPLETRGGLNQCPIALLSDIIEVLSDIMVPAGGCAGGGGVDDVSGCAPQPITNAMASAISAIVARAISLLIRYTFTSSR